MNMPEDVCHNVIIKYQTKWTWTDLVTTSSLDRVDSPCRQTKFVPPVFHCIIRHLVCFIQRNFLLIWTKSFHREKLCHFTSLDSQTSRKWEMSIHFHGYGHHFFAWTSNEWQRRSIRCKQRQTPRKKNSCKNMFRLENFSNQIGVTSNWINDIYKQVNQGDELEIIAAY